MFRRALEWFGGSVLVYALVAACAGADLDGEGDASSGAADGDGGRSGMGASGSGGTGSGNAPGSTGGTSMMNPVPDALAFPESGSRLKVRTIEGADGSANVIAGQFYDSELEETCYPGRGADGVTRCLPSAQGANTYFSDADCTGRLVATLKGCLAPKYASWSTAGSSCGTDAMGVAPVGSQVVPSELYMRSGESCIELSAASTNQTVDFYSVGAELPASTFVAITEGTL